MYHELTGLFKSALLAHMRFCQVLNDSVKTQKPDLKFFLKVTVCSAVSSRNLLGEVIIMLD